MTEDFNFKFYGTVDVAPIREKINAANFDWDEFQVRQQKYVVHRETQTIPLLFNEEDPYKPIVRPAFQIFQPDLDRINQFVNQAVGGIGLIRNVIFTRMHAGARIYPHMDKSAFFKITHRFHVPVFTNPDCFFTVADERVNMAEGDVWEINNDNKTHSVENNGKTDRIHLIFDWQQIK